MNHDEKKSPIYKQQKEESKTKNSHRYESISYKKHLLKRHLGNNATNNSKRSKETNAQNKGEKTQIKNALQKEFVYVKNHTKENSDHVKELPKITRTKEIEPDQIYPRGNKSDFHILQQSGIYQLDLSEVRNEIPPVQHEPLPPVSSAQTERGYRSRKLQRASRHIHAKTVEQKWRDDCDCLRCDIIRRQFAEGDMTSYRNWGNYPCMKLSKSRGSNDTFYYDSD